MAMLLSHSPRRLLRLLKPESLLPRTLYPTMTSPSPPHFLGGNLPPEFGPSGWSSGPPQWPRALCTYSSAPGSSSGVCEAGLVDVTGTTSPDVVQASQSPFWSMEGPGSPSPSRRKRKDEVHAVTPKPAQKGDSETTLDMKTVKIVTLNVWSRKSMELPRRMNAIGDLIQHHTPDLICLQEVTPEIYMLLKDSAWWGEYECSISCEMAMKRVVYCMQMSKLPVDSFGRYFVKGRELWTADVSIGGVTMVVATSHLVTTPWSGAIVPRGKSTTYKYRYSDERVAQARKCLRILRRLPNVIFCGDMNWDEKLDGAFPLWIHGGWVDAWAELRPDEAGWTYDTKANPMLSANTKLQKRLDRFVCRLADFDMDDIEMIGTEAVPGVSYEKTKRIGGVTRELVLPVLPSDHFGLLLRITRRQAGSASSESDSDSEDSDSE